jgi:hypothetical protein
MVEDDALRLVRAINELQAKDRVGELVSVSNEVTHRTRLGPEFHPRSPRCNAAVDYLVERGALVPEEGLEALHVVGKAYGFFRITETGLDMARS